MPLSEYARQMLLKQGLNPDDYGYEDEIAPKCAPTRINENRRIYFYIAFNERGVAEFLRGTLGADVYNL